MKLPKEGCSCSGRATRSARGGTLWQAVACLPKHVRSLVALLLVVVPTLAFCDSVTTGQVIESEPELNGIYACTPRRTLQETYNDVDAVAHVRLLGQETTGDPETTGETITSKFEVLDSWKTKLPKFIETVWKEPRKGDSSFCDGGGPPYYFSRRGEYILYLLRNNDGTLRVQRCSWNTHESDLTFKQRLSEFKNAEKCGCNGYAGGGYDLEYLFHRAEYVMDAVVRKVWKEGRITYAEIMLMPGTLIKPAGDVPILFGMTLPIVVDKGDGCGFPVTVYKSKYWWSAKNRYFFYLNYWRQGVPGYITNICSGNEHYPEGTWFKSSFEEKHNFPNG